MKNRKQGTLFITLFACFMSFLIIPISSMLLFFKCGVEQKMEQQIYQINQQSLSLMRVHIENQFNKILNQVQLLNYNVEIENLNSISLDNYNDNGDNIYKIKEVVDLCSMIKDGSSDILSVFYVDCSEGYIITSEGDFTSIDSRQGMEWLKNFSGLSSTVLLNTQFSERFFKITPPPRQNIAAITILCPINRYQAGNSQMIAVHVSAEALGDYLRENHGLLNGEIYLIDLEGSVVASTDASVVGRSVRDENERFFEMLSAGQKSGYFAREDGNSVSYLVSDTFSWCYVNVQPTSEFEQSITQMWMILWLGVLALVLCGIALSYAISRKIYQPVGEMVRLLDSKMSFKNKNELKIINVLMDEITRNEDELKEVVQKNQTELRRFTFLRAIGGAQEGIDLSEVVRKDYFVCLLFALNRPDSALDDDFDKQRNFKYFFVQICESVINEYMEGFAVLLNDGNTAAILQADAENINQVYAHIQAIYHTLSERTSSVYPSGFSLGVGEVYNDPQYVQTSFLEAKEALQYRILFGKGRPVFYFEISEREQEYYFPESTVRKLCNYIDAGDEAKFEQEISNIARMIRQQNFGYDNIHYIFYQILGGIINYLLENHIQTSMVFDNNEEIFTKLTKFDSLEEICGWFVSICRKIIVYRRESEQFKERYYDSIQKVIAENYRNGDLDLSFVASQVGLSYSHLRKKFKEYFDSSFTDYVNRLRIASAKALLADSDATVEQVSEQSGFNSYQSFCRVFKKMEGITPGQYRERHHKK